MSFEIWLKKLERDDQGRYIISSSEYRKRLHDIANPIFYRDLSFILKIHKKVRCVVISLTRLEKLEAAEAELKKIKQAEEESSDS